MSGLVTLTLVRTSSSPWGLRLQGGVDFEKALVISNVTEGTPSHQSGLKAGDVLVQINGLEAALMTHKQAQQAIISGGNEVGLVVQRTGQGLEAGAPGTWKPEVQIVGGPATSLSSNPGQTYTKTSLKIQPQQEEEHWDARHNVTAKAFQPSSSDSNGNVYCHGFKSISAPTTKPTAGPPPTGPPQPQTCWRCNLPIQGVFLQIKGRPIHGECFVCSVCRTSLKNVGHFLIAEKLYCQPHAMAAQAQLQGAPPQEAEAGPAKQAMPQGLAANLAKLAVRPSPAAGQPAPVRQPVPAVGQPANDWGAKLDGNMAGMAENAEDFTKQFMKQLGGGQ